MEEFDIQTQPAEPVEPGEAEAVATEPAEAGEADASACQPGPTEDLTGQPEVSVDELLPAEPNVEELPLTLAAIDDAQLRASLEAIVYVTEEPVTVAQIAAALQQPQERILLALKELAAEYEKAEHGLTIKEVAGGYKMATKAEHHETVRTFVKSLKAPLKLSLPALETLAVVAYKQPVTAPEIMEIRGVQGAGVLKTLLDRKLIAAAGRKNVIGKPILYKTTREFMVQFGLKDLAELPSLKEFEEIRRLAFTDDEAAGPAEAAEIPEAGAAADGEPTAPAEGAVASRSEEAPAAPDEPAPAVDAGAPADESEIDQGG